MQTVTDYRARGSARDIADPSAPPSSIVSYGRYPINAKPDRFGLEPDCPAGTDLGSGSAFDGLVGSSWGPCSQHVDQTV